MASLKPDIRKLLKYLLFGFISMAITAPGLATAMDHSLFGELLDKYVKKGIVDYQGFKKNEGHLDNYLELLSKTDIQALGREKQFAFYINAYNAGTIKLILSKYPDITSIWDLGNRVFNSPFKKKFIELGARKVSLDHIENDILRPRFGDPRVHFAINCASKSCPPLLSEPYRGEILDRQLDNAARTFINDTRFNRLAGDTLYVSRIFKWFSDDFDDDPLSFFLKYAVGELKEKLALRKSEIRIRYLDYDWSLNGK